MAKKKPPEEHVNLERWLVSYGDFMTLLLATFVVLYALSQVDIAEFSKLEESIKKAFNAPSLLEGSENILDGSESIFDAQSADSVIEPLMLEYMSQRYESNAFNQIKESINELTKNGDLEGVNAKITETGLLITFKEDLLFFSASAALTDRAMATLDKVGALISQQFAMHNIRVEGHTDNQPINTIMFPSNWELSTARSSAIIRYFLTRFKFIPGIFTAVGYSDTRPIEDNKTPEGREKNRRVEILILKNKYKQFEHPSNTLIKQPKKVQEEFQKQRMEALDVVKNDNKELTKLKVRSSLEKPVEKAVPTKLPKEKPQNEEKTLSIKNKSLYEQATVKQNEKANTNSNPNANSDEIKNKNQDDNFLNNFSKSKILQKDINDQFEPTGQQ